MIVVVATLRAASGCGNELAEELARVVETRSREPGNLCYFVARSDADPEEFHLFELYRDSAALAEHQAALKSAQNPHRETLPRLMQGAPRARLATLVAAASKLPQRQ